MVHEPVARFWIGWLMKNVRCGSALNAWKKSRSVTSMFVSGQKVVGVVDLAGVRGHGAMMQVRDHAGGTRKDGARQHEPADHQPMLRPHTTRRRWAGRADAVLHGRVGRIGLHAVLCARRKS